MCVRDDDDDDDVVDLSVCGSLCDKVRYIR